MDNTSTKKNAVPMRQRPNNYEAEQSLLGAMLLDNEVAGEIIGEIEESDFYYESHRLIYDAVKSLSMASQPIDLVTISDKLGSEKLAKIGGIMYISEIMNILPSAANYRDYLDIVKKDGKLRKIIRSAEKIIENSYDADDENKAVAFAEKMIYGISESDNVSELTHVKESALEVMQKFQEILTNPESSLGLLTHFKNLDEITHGYLPGQLIVIAARPGCGKTTFALNIVGNIVRHDPSKKIAVFNLEMNKNEVSERLMIGMAQVKLETMLTAKGTKDDYAKLWEVNQRLADANVYIDDTAKTTAEMIMSKCRRLSQKVGGLDLIVIDYLQLLESPESSKNRNSSKQQEVADISREMKIMAKELKVPIILLSQMSRDVEKRDDKTPKLSDLRESGAIEQDADQVYFLSRPDQKSDEEVDSKFVDLIIAKHRAGSTGTIYFKFENDMLKFIPAKEKSKFIARHEEGKGTGGDTIEVEEVIENSEEDFVDSGISAEYIDSLAAHETDYQSGGESVDDILSDFDI